MSTFTPLSAVSLLQPLHHCQQCHCAHLYTTVSSVTVSTITPLSAVSLYQPLHHCQQCHCINHYTTISSVTVPTFTPLSVVSLCPPLHHCQQCHCIHHKPRTNLPGLFCNISLPKRQKQYLKVCRAALSVPGVCRRIPMPLNNYACV